MALDAGTSGVRAVAFGNDLTVVDSQYHELTQFYPRPGEVEHDPAEIVRLSIEVLTAVAGRQLSLGHRVLALGITNQRETTIAFDRADGTSQHRAIVWQDRRTMTQCETLRDAGYLNDVRSTTGLVLDPYFSGTKMRWLLDHGALEGAREPALCTVDALVVWHLTGAQRGGLFVTEGTNASRTMLLDLYSLKWSAAMSTMLGVPTELLPEVRASAGHFGLVSADVCEPLAGVPITGVLGDQQAALFGQACFAPGTIKATYGTGAFLLTNAGPEVPSAPDGLVGTLAWDLGEFGPRTYALEGSAFVAGAAIQWLRDELGFIVESKDLETLATSVPDAGGVCFVPAFTGLGSPFWRPEARGALSGLTRGSNRAHIARAVFEAQVFQVRSMTDAFAGAGVPLVELRADGGAAAMDTLLDLQATASRLTVRRASSLEATAKGAACAAGLAVGVWESLDELASLWRSNYEATPGDSALLDAAYAQWLRAVDRA